MLWIFDPSWSLIFGGCCSNVYTLEAIVKNEPDSGLIITFSQFVIAAVVGLPTQLERSSASPWGFRIRKTAIPLPRLAVMGLMFFSMNMLNNWAFAFHIAVPMHIILRSFSSVTTMAIGWLWGKRYSQVQVVSVVVMTVGVIISAWADANRKAAARFAAAAAAASARPGLGGSGAGGAVIAIPASSSSYSSFSTHSKVDVDALDEKATGSFGAGILILFVSQVIAALMGIYAEQAYSKFGRHWQETVFYTHALGLPLSMTFASTLWRQFDRLARGPAALFWIFSPGMSWTRASWWPSHAVLMLVLNVVTQLACVSGVNHLAARSTAVTVTVVLNIRKLVSFLLSCIIFGNKVAPLLGLGAALVFVAGAVYGWDSTRRGKAGKAVRSAKADEMAQHGAHVKEGSKSPVLPGAGAPLSNGNVGVPAGGLSEKSRKVG